MTGVDVLHSLCGKVPLSTKVSERSPIVEIEPDVSHSHDRRILVEAIEKRLGPRVSTVPRCRRSPSRQSDQETGNPAIHDDATRGRNSCGENVGGTRQLMTCARR